MLGTKRSMGMQCWLSEATVGATPGYHWLSYGSAKAFRLEVVRVQWTEHVGSVGRLGSVTGKLVLGLIGVTGICMAMSLLLFGTAYSTVSA